MPKIEIRLLNVRECTKEILQTKETKTMNKGFEQSSHKRNLNDQLI